MIRSRRHARVSVVGFVVTTLLVGCGGTTRSDGGTQPIVGDAATSGGSAGSSGGASSGGGSTGASGGKSASAGSPNGSGGTTPEVTTCMLNSDCAGTLVCMFGLCHAQCATAKDCPASQRCVVEASGNVCQLEQESGCLYNSDCTVPLVCAVDKQCRNQCANNRDCIVGQLCVNGVCANPSDLNATGQLNHVAPDAG